MPLGTLGTGSIEICSDGRFRNLAINNNRTESGRIAVVPHSFMAVGARGREASYVRRLQLSESGADTGRFLGADGLHFRAHYPLADCRVNDPGAPVEVVWSAFSPVVPYDYDASALPLLYLGIQITNVTEESLDVSALLNWQNTCGQRTSALPAFFAPIVRETLMTQGDLERMKGPSGGDNERRLSSKTGHIESHQAADIKPGDVMPNALVFGDVRTIDSNEDGQYCVVTPWTPGVRPALRVWDPESRIEEEAFWRDFVVPGGYDSDGIGQSGIPRCGAVCNRFRLDPGQTRSVEFAVAWYCPRYVVNGIDEGNFYTNHYSDARSVARAGLANSRYYYAAINGWQQRLTASDLPSGLARKLFSSSEVLSTNSIHTRNGAFGLFESAGDTRVNYLRDRWFWSMGLLLFFPRLELDILDRLSQRLLDDGGRLFRISEGLEGFSEGEFVAPGAAQVEVCVHLVTMTWRNFLFGGSLSFLSRLAPRIQSALATLIAQDKDFDGFPDIQHEAPELDCAFASGLNVITAGLWIVALGAGERIARRQQMAEAAIYKQALDRALRSFEHYYWNAEFGYYTLYPDPRFKLSAESALQGACHVGQLHGPWIAELLGLDSLFPARRVLRAIEAIETHNRVGEELSALSWPGGTAPENLNWNVGGAVQVYNELRYACCKLQQQPDGEEGALVQSVTQDTRAILRHVSELAPWYLILASPAARLDLADKRLVVRPDMRQRGQKRNYTLYTPNGFGAVSVQSNPTGPIHCQIDFRMDIPQELAAIHVLLPEGISMSQCRLDLEEGPVPLNVNTFTTGKGTRIELFPETKLSASAFSLFLLAADGDANPSTSKTQWIPRWLRR